LQVIVVSFLFAFNHNGVDAAVSVFVRFGLKVNCWAGLKLGHRYVVSSYNLVGCLETPLNFGVACTTLYLFSTKNLRLCGNLGGDRV
jgi:hypothetical protein